MTRYTEHENFRVVVELRGPAINRNYYTPQTLEQRYAEQAQEVIAQIKRHVDAVADARFVFDVLDYCGKCGNTWQQVLDENGVSVCAYCGTPEAA